MNAKILLLNLLALFVVAINAEDIADGNFEVYNSELFESAWKYQNLVSALQQDINTELFDVRTEISRVLRRTTNNTLFQIEANSQMLIEMDQVVFNELKKNNLADLCIVELTKAKDVITFMADTQSTNNVRAYNKAVDNLIAGSYINLNKYNNWLTDVQLIVAKSFNIVQVFTGPGIIKNNFETQYNNIIEEWGLVKPNIKNQFVTLETNINNQNQILIQSFEKIYNSIKVKYDDVIDSMQICIDFGSYTPFRAPVQAQVQADKLKSSFFPKDKFIPVFD